MKPAIAYPVFALLLFTLAGCNQGGGDAKSSDSSGAAGTFQVLVSNNKANERVEMSVTEETTFGEVKAFALGALNLSGQTFELRVAGKAPAATEKLGDHGFKAPPQPMKMPVGNILVKIKD